MIRNMLGNRKYLSSPQLYCSFLSLSSVYFDGHHRKHISITVLKNRTKELTKNLAKNPRSFYFWGKMRITLLQVQQCVFILLLTILQESTQVSFEEDIRLTYQQKDLLDKFKEKVKSRLPHDYMLRDIYLIRWLRAKNYNLQEAENMLMENILWRKISNMDTIINEDFTDFETRYPYFLEGCDKEGRPVASVSVGDWDIRSAVVSGKGDRVLRYFDKLIEEINVLVRKSQEQGKNVTQYSLIFDLGNYNLVQQGCSNCISVYFGLFNSYENHWPGAVHKMYLVNTPPLFQALLSVIRPLMSPLTRDSLFIYGKDKSQWQSALLEDISKDHLSTAFGGTKESGLEPEELRKLTSTPC